MRRTHFLYTPFLCSPVLYAPQATYLFYDWETTGLDPVFAQGVRLAANRTTPDFKVIETHEINICLRSDVIIEPAAAIVNRLGPEHLRLGGTEYESAKYIHELVNTPGTTSIGLNSLAFDDLFLRFLFYRNFLNPYSHHQKNNCARMDVYPITVAAFYLFPEMLKWPTKKNTKKVSFKLEDINTENRLFDGQAHDAMTDTKVTLELARRLSNNKKLWGMIAECFDKKTDKKRIETCQSTINIGTEGCKIGYIINNCSVGDPLIPVLLLGESKAYSNQALFLKLGSLDCKRDPKKIDIILKNVKVTRKKYGQAPFFMPMTAEQVKEFKAMFVNEIAWLASNPTVLPSIQTHFLNQRYADVQCDAYARLYQLPLLTEADEALFKKFHEAQPRNKLSVAAHFPNATHRELALRLVGNHFPEELKGKARDQFDQYLQTVFTTKKEEARIDYTGDPAVTLADAVKQADELGKTSLDDEKAHILELCDDWLRVQQIEFAPSRQSRSTP